MARHPVVVLLVALVTTGVLASFVPQQELSNDSAAFSPETDEVLAQRELAERFDDAGTTTLQVVVTGDDVISADGARTLGELLAIAQDIFGDALLQPEGAPAAAFSYLTPAQALAEREGVDLASADDAEVDRLQQAALEGPPAGAAPPEGAAPGAEGDAPSEGGSAEGQDRAAADGRGEGAGPGQAGEQPGFGFAEQLSAGDDDTSAPSGLVLLTLDDTAYDGEEALNAAQVAFSDAVEAADLPLDALPFSFALVADPGDDFQAEVGRLFGTALLVILVVLAFVLRARRGDQLSGLAAVRRSAADMAMSVFAVVLGVVWLQGLAVLLGPEYLGLVGQATPPTQIVPILLLALGVSYSIYVQSRYREELNRTDADGTASLDVHAAVSRLGPTIGVALLLSMITTAIGFLTNVSSPIPAVQDLGVLAAVGIVVIFLLTLTVLPAIRLLLDRVRERRDEGRVPRDEVAASERSPFARVAMLGLQPALRAPLAVLAVAGLLAAGGAWSLTQLDVEFDTAAFLPEDSPLVAAIDVLERDFGGGLAETTDVLVVGDAVADPDFEQTVQSLRTDLGEVPGVVDVGGGADLTVQVDDQPGGASGEPAARLALRTQSDDVGVDTLVDGLDDALAPVRDLGLETTLTSDAIITDDVTESLGSSSTTGMVVTVLAVLVLLSIVYGVRLRQPLLGTVMTIPVGVVVLWTFGLMYVTGIPFDPITAIIAALVIGVGIDFSIHLGERFLADLEEHDRDVPAALRASLRHTGAALAGSATTTVLGFSALTFASIVPFQRMGIVTIYAVALSLLSALSVLPPLLVLYGRWRNRRADDAPTGQTDQPLEELTPA